MKSLSILVLLGSVSAGSCPYNFPFAYQGNNVYGGWCCSTSPSSTGVYGWSVHDHCNGSYTSCTSSPCFDAVVKCPSNNPWAYQGNNVAGGYCCSQRPLSTGVYGWGVQDHCYGSAIACSRAPCHDAYSYIEVLANS